MKIINKEEFQGALTGLERVNSRHLTNYFSHNADFTTDYLGCKPKVTISWLSSAGIMPVEHEMSFFTDAQWGHGSRNIKIRLTQLGEPIRTFLPCIEQARPSKQEYWDALQQVDPALTEVTVDFAVPQDWMDANKNHPDIGWVVWAYGLEGEGITGEPLNMQDYKYKLIGQLYSNTPAHFNKKTLRDLRHQTKFITEDDLVNWLYCLSQDQMQSLERTIDEFKS